MNSTLNELLLAIEKETLGKSGKDVNHKSVMQLLAAIEKMCADDDCEIPNNVLQGLDNDVRRMIFSGFALGLKSYTLACGMASTAQDLLEAGEPTDDADKWKTAADKPESEMTALEKLLKQKPPGRN